MMSELSAPHLYVLYALLVAGAAAAVWLRGLLASVMAMGVFGFVLTAVFVFWRAPDVAMAQAAIGSGLVTALFVMAIRRSQGEAS